MGKIYAPHINYNPDYTKDWKEIEKYEKEYLKEVQDYARKNGTGDYAGEVLRISHADGYAQYVVVSLKPVKLIHLPIGDAWAAPYVHRMTASDIKWEIDRRNALAKMFAGM